MQLGSELVELAGFNLFTEKGSPFIKNEQEKPGTDRLTTYSLPNGKPYQPIFNQSKIETSMTLVGSGSTGVLLMKQPADAETDHKEARVVIVFVTAKFKAPAERSGNLSQESAVEIEIPTKKGKFIRDPDVPDAGMIDVTGYPKGTEVKSPYTGKILRVP